MAITEEKFVEVLKTGSLWKKQDIRKYLEEYIADHSTWANHTFQWDSQDKLYYIYDNECYLFVEDDKIITRCDREDINSSGMQHSFTINKSKDADTAYMVFKMMTMEEAE